MSSLGGSPPNASYECKHKVCPGSLFRIFTLRQNGTYIANEQKQIRKYCWFDVACSIVLLALQCGVVCLCYCTDIPTGNEASIFILIFTAQNPERNISCTQQNAIRIPQSL